LKVPGPGAYEVRFLVTGGDLVENGLEAKEEVGISLNGVVFAPSGGQMLTLAMGRDVWLEPEVVQVESQLELHVPEPSEVGWRVKLMEVARQSTALVYDPPLLASFNQVNPVKYEVVMENEDPAWLVFNETFNPGWHAYILPSDEGDVVARGSVLLTWVRHHARWHEVDRHYPVNAYANGWLLDEAGTHHILVLYLPQVWHEATLMVSGGTLFGCLAFLALSAVHRGGWTSRNGRRSGKS
jgi:hypothetical protein